MTSAMLLKHDREAWPVFDLNSAERRTQVVNERPALKFRMQLLAATYVSL